MASFRTTLSEDNMDIIMYLVRELDKNPSEVINLIIDQPQILIDARSRLNGKEQKVCYKE
jgi:hypothetical protein